MLLIGAINILLGLQSYKAPTEPARIELALLPDAGPPDAAGTISASELPAVVMRAFAIKYPHILPLGALVEYTALPSGSAAGRDQVPAGEYTALPSGSAAGRDQVPAGEYTALPSGSAAGPFYVITFPPGKGHAHARFAADGSFVSDD